MATYTTNLKTWGSTGQEYPDNYSYVEGEQPVDAWDNFFNYNTIEDIQHLVDLTNARVADEDGSEAQSGGVRLQNAEWLAARNAAGDGDLQMWSANASDQIAAGGVVKLGGDLLAEGGEVIWDESTGNIPSSAVEDLFVKTDGDTMDGDLTISNALFADQSTGDLDIAGELTEGATI